MASLLSRVLAPAAAKLGVANNTRVLAVKQNILNILVPQIGSLQHILEIGLGKACGISQAPEDNEILCRHTLLVDEDVRAVVETGSAGLVCQAGGG